MDQLHAEVVPAQKAAKVMELQQRGEVVAMVGDGVNDSPALAQADVGMAIGAGADIAAATADIVLVNSQPQSVIHAIELSEAAFSRIRWNFVWAMGFNCVGIPLAAGALYPPYQISLPPMFAGLAMACSSVTVVCSSLLLKRWTPTDPAAFANVTAKEIKTSRLLRHAQLVPGHIVMSTKAVLLGALSQSVLAIVCVVLIMMLAGDDGGDGSDGSHNSHGM